MSDTTKQQKHAINHGAPLGVAAMDDGLTAVVKAFTAKCPINTCTQHGKGSSLCLSCSVYKKHNG